MATQLHKQRARTDDEKALRKQSIIDALAQLLTHANEVLPSANDIAQQAKITKGVIYRYFASREEIFLTLLLQRSQPFVSALAQDYHDWPSFKQMLERCFSQDALFMRLNIMAPVVLETNISVEFIRQFKLSAAHIFEQLADKLTPFCQQPEVLRRQFVFSCYQCALMSFQMSHPPQPVRQAFAEQSLWLVEMDYQQVLAQNLEWLWLGFNQQPNHQPLQPAIR